MAIAYDVPEISDERMEQAVGVGHFDAGGGIETLGWNADDLWQRLQAQLPAGTSLVVLVQTADERFTHGFEPTGPAELEAIVRKTPGLGQYHTLFYFALPALVTS